MSEDLKLCECGKHWGLPKEGEGPGMVFVKCAHCREMETVALRLAAAVMAEDELGCKYSEQLVVAQLPVGEWIGLVKQARDFQKAALEALRKHGRS